MLLQNKAKDGALSMIKIAGIIQTADDLLIDKSDDSINVEELSKAEASRIQALFIQQIFENTISEENPQLEYSYEVDSKANIKKVRELLDENIADYFYNNYYAMPVICYEGSTITLKVEETNRFTSILDTQLVTELRNFIENSKENFKQNKLVSFDKLSTEKHQMYIYKLTRKIVIIGQLRDLGYIVKTTVNDFSMLIGIPENNK